MSARCHACGAERRPAMSFEEFMAARPVPKTNAFGRVVECLFCSARIPPGKPGRPSVTCAKSECRKQLRQLKAISQSRGAK